MESTTSLTILEPPSVGSDPSSEDLDNVREYFEITKRQLEALRGQHPDERCSDYQFVIQTIKKGRRTAAKWARHTLSATQMMDIMGLESDALVIASRPVFLRSPRSPHHTPMRTPDYVPSITWTFDRNDRPVYVVRDDDAELSNISTQIIHTALSGGSAFIYKAKLLLGLGGLNNTHDHTKIHWETTLCELETRMSSTGLREIAKKLVVLGVGRSDNARSVGYALLRIAVNHPDALCVVITPPDHEDVLCKFRDAARLVTS